MRIVVIGAGRSGIYVSLLARKRFPFASIRVYEQNPPDATCGLGIVLADRELARFHEGHFESLMLASFVSRLRVISRPDESLFMEGGGYGGAIARLRLLEILREFWERGCIVIQYGPRLLDTDAYAEADLIVGADGEISEVRRRRQTEFGTTYYSLTNRIASHDTTQHFPLSAPSFKRNPFGHFVTAAYSYAEQMSTFVAECDEATYSRARLDRMSDDQQRRFTEPATDDELAGHALIANNTAYRQLPVRYGHRSRPEAVSA